MRRGFTIIAATAALAAGCSQARQYELRGQVLAVDRTRREMTIRHEDIRGFMPGMTMPFRVRDARLLEERHAGDLITATLVVEGGDAYLANVRRTGHSELMDPPHTYPRMDLLAPGELVPDLRITDEAASSRTLADWRGRVVAVTFMYTRCPLPDFCPRMDQHFAAVQRSVAADQVLRARVRLLSVSLDPDFDTPQLLAAHAQRAGADPEIWRFVTGDRDAISSFASRFGVSTIRETPDVQNITHNLRTAVIRSDGRVERIFSGNEWTPEELLDALKTAR
jgi:protein SCO1/2